MAHWLDTAVFYEIYPQSFMDSNGDGIGDFRGIESKLPYLQELGCNAIWMNPCFDSSFYDAGYDVRDYFTVAARYGTNEDLRQLFDAVHARGMHILLDLVPGHTAIDNEWFKMSGAHQRNEYSDRYIWREFSAGGERNKPYDNIAGFISGLAERPAMAAYNCFTTQPCLNYGFANVTESWQCAADSPEALGTRQLLKDIMSFWLDLGCDGFRVDMAGSLVKQDPGRKATIALWQDIRQFLDKNYPEAVLVSEWGDPDQALDAGFHMDFLLHNGPTHYMDLFRTHPFFSAEHHGDLVEFVEHYKNTYEATKDKGLICIPSGNHDMVRMRETLNLEEMKMAFAFLLTMPGCPFIYYGDEIGIPYAADLVSKEGGYDRTGSRTPMQWTRKVNAGFSAARPDRLYLPVDRSEDRTSVEQQKEDPDSLLRHVQELIAFRRMHSSLNSNAEFRFLTDGSTSPLVYERRDDEEHLVILLNPFDMTVYYDLADDEEEMNTTIEFRYGSVSLDNNSVQLEPRSYAILSI